eukprot:scaffold831_cov151-Skeletonema_menzelii.AAC.1
MNVPPRKSFPPPPPMAPTRRAASETTTTEAVPKQQQQQQGDAELRRKSAPQQHNRHHHPPPLLPESSKDITKQDPVASVTSNFHPAAIPTYSSTTTRQPLPPSKAMKRAGSTGTSGGSTAAPRRTSASSSSTGNIHNRATAETQIISDNIARNLSGGALDPSVAAVPPVSKVRTTTTTTNLYPHYNPTTTATKSYLSQYPSPYLPNPSSDTLKARHVGSTTNSGNFNMQQNSYILNVNASTSITNTKSAAQQIPHNNNIPIAILLLPPLFILLIYEMSSPLPLLLLCCIGLIVYALDLANVGGGIGSNSNHHTTHHRGFYTLCAIWIGWIVISIVVGYVTIFLGDTVLTPSTSGNDLDDEGGTTTTTTFTTSYTSTNFLSLGILLAKLGASIILLFNLAAWTTLQFQWLPLQIPTLARFLERLIHFTLPPISAAMISYELTVSSSLSSSYNIVSSWGLDTAAMVFPLLFACHLSLGIFLVGAAPSMLGSSIMDEKEKKSPDKHSKKNKAGSALFHCAISPREGRALSYLLVFIPGTIHLVMFRQRITYSYASWDDLFDFIFTATLPYVLHYLLASNGVIDERWRNSLNWLLKSGTSPIECGRTLRGAAVPMAISFLSCMSIQQRYLVPLCARISYLINGHDGIMSASLATLLLSLGTIFGYVTMWFFRRQNSNGDFLMGDYHEDIFQLLLGLSAVFFGLSCSPPWAALPIPMLLAESLALWVITKQLRYAFLTVFVFFTCCSILIVYRLTFLTETVEIMPGKQILLKTFARVSMFATMWLIIIIGLVHRAPGGIGKDLMKKYDATGASFAIYGFVLGAMEFSLLRQPMPVYSRDSFEFGTVAVYSSSAVYCTGVLTLLIVWHLKAQKLIKGESAVVASSTALGKMIAVIIQPNIVGVDNSLSAMYLRWTVASLLLMTICCPYALRPVYIKSSNHLPKNASMIVVAYCAVILPLVIIASVRLVLEPLVGLLTGHNNTAFYVTSPKFSEVLGYSAALWGVSVLSMVNHYLPNGGGEVWKRVAALTLIMGLFVSFSAPAFPGSATSESSDLFLSVSSNSAVESEVATGGWGLVSAFLAVLLALTGPLELREVKESAGRKDSRQFLRLMIFGLMFGCGLAWFIVMQSMSKDVFIPIFVTAFSCMVMSTLGTVCAVMGYFLETQEFGEVEQIANVWAVVAFPVFFVISSVSLSAHAHPFGIGGWASTYLSVCGLLAGAFCILVRMRKDKTSTTRGYGNVGCIISWLCTIIVIYGRYGIAGVGVVGVTTVVGIPVSILATLCASPILILLEGEGSSSSKYTHQRSSTKSKWHGLVLTKLTRRNWIAPLLIGTVGVFITASLYAIFLRGCGLSKFSFLFGANDVITNQEDVFSHIFGSKRTTGIGALDDVATMAQKSVVHTKTMIAAARLSGSGIWTAKSIIGPFMHLLGLAATLPSLQFLVQHSWYGKAPLFGKLVLALPLNILSIIVGRGIPSLVAAATIGLIGGALQLTTIKNR